MARPSPVRFVAPDVIIRLRNNNFEVEVVESLRFSLRVNPLYHRLAAAAAVHPQGRVPTNGHGATAPKAANGEHSGGRDSGGVSACPP